MESSSRIEIEKFNGRNFDLWKIKIEYILVDREQWTIVYPGIMPTCVEGRMGETWEKRKEYDLTLSFIVSIVECIKWIFDQETMGQVGKLIPVEISSK